MAQIFAIPVIFRQITELDSEIPEKDRWEIARRIKEASIESRNYPPGLADRFSAIVAAADMLTENKLPMTVGNLQEQAFTAALQAYRWIWDNHLLACGREFIKKRQIRVTAEEVRIFATRMQIHHNRFRSKGVHSDLCQGSILFALAETGQLGDLAEHIITTAKASK